MLEIGIIGGTTRSESSNTTSQAAEIHMKPIERVYLLYKHIELGKFFQAFRSLASYAGMAVSKGASCTERKCSKGRENEPCSDVKRGIGRCCKFSHFRTSKRGPNLAD